MIEISSIFSAKKDQDHYDDIYLASCFSVDKCKSPYVGLGNNNSKCFQMVSIILKPLKLQIDCLMCSHTMHQLSAV